MGVLYKIKAVFNPETCLKCGFSGKGETYMEDYMDGHTLLEQYWKCSKCGEHLVGISYGSYDDPFWYMDTKIKRFLYLFFGKY